MVKLLFTLCILYGYSTLVFGQQPNYEVFNYTVNDGLPSNECHDIIQDSLGYIWMATDRGLVKWDGYNFGIYGLQKGLKDMSCIGLYLDERNNIWINTISSGLFRYEARGDTIVEYKHNDILLNYSIGRSYLGEFVVFNNGDLIVNIHGRGPLKITNDGEMTSLAQTSELPFVNVAEFKEKILISTVIDLDAPSEQHHELVPQASFNIKGNLLEACSNLDNSRNEIYSLAYYVGRDSIYFTHRGIKYFYTNGKIESCKPSYAPVNDLIVNNKGEIYTCGIDFEGVHFSSTIEDLINEKSINLLPNISASRILLDREDNLWVTSLTRGLFYLKKSDVFKVNSSVITDFDLYNSKIIALESNRILKEYSSFFESNIIEEYTTEKRALIVDAINHFAIVAGHKPSLVELLDIGKFDSNKNNKISPFSSTSAQILNNDHFVIWGRSNIEKYNREFKGLTSLTCQNINSLTRITFVYLNKEEELFIGTTTGLYYSNNGICEKVEYDKSRDNNLRINGILEVQNGMALATIGRGLIVYNEDSHYDINVENGLISNNLESVKYFSENQIVTTSKSGFSILEYQDDGKYRVLRNYNVSKGLPSNEVTEVKLKGDTIIVGTLGGLAYILDKPSATSVSRPFIESVKVNDAPRLSYESMLLSHEENDVNISFKALDYRQHGILRYRYRINNASWIESTNTSVDYASLQPEEYKFYLQAQSIDGTWGDEVSFSFKILKPWWNTIWFYVLMMLSLVALGYGLYWIRIKSVIQAAKMEEHLRTLEMSALRAQMNPHFIFNCLNSIQSFIMTNEKERAMNYLSSFAKLVRHTLNSSMNSSISLGIEISMLENYLNLEKLRHKNRFNFRIVVDKNLDLLSTNIPPLLIQPYVENAVIHGMFGVKEGGEILINFYSSSSDFISVQVRDNGKGNAHQNVKKAHKSVGMNITSQRLKLLNRQESKSLSVSTDYSEKGSLVKLNIRKIIE